jgi:hypothetical protein
MLAIVEYMVKNISAIPQNAVRGGGYACI